jgi:hypothetical protein
MKDEIDKYHNFNGGNMSNLVSDVVFLVALLFLLAVFVRGFKLLIVHSDKDAGLYGGFLVLVIVVPMSVFVIGSLYVLYLLNIHILPAESVKLEASIYLLITSIAAFFLSGKIKKAALNYCVECGFIDAKE